MVNAACELQNVLCGNLTRFRKELYGIGNLNRLQRMQLTIREREGSDAEKRMGLAEP
jgi:hypothetical protein